jgi:hypothetical protein
MNDDDLDPARAAVASVPLGVVFWCVLWLVWSVTGR